MDLDQAWGVTDPAERGQVAALYRRMTDADVRRGLVARLPDDVRLVFQRLAQSGKPLSRADLLRVLPFSEDRIEASLAALEEVGLAWRYAPNARSRVEAEREWLVPVELRDAPRAVRPMPPPTEPPESVPADRPAAPALRTLDRISGAIRSGGSLPRIVGDLDRIEKGRAGAVQPGAGLLGFAEHCGLALGVWIRDGDGLRAGPRFAVWQQLTSAERVRALARLWLVDDRSPCRVSAQLRRALWQVLTLVDENTWYDVDSLARRVAWQIAYTGTEQDDGAPLHRGHGRRGSMTRRELEVAIDVLGWIGVVLVADAERAHRVAIQLTAEGRRALVQEPGHA